ncbi:FKBP-type peptidyl-prolyl cis-trans isomerase [Microbacterium sp. W1N]|uniref:FKBP-type peptidyl-prolyl cis-trans isomerase n=1 Tax=Microbacterium festucae TaxID=2977531 RepID=UPI0021C162C3|nr:FKBP-type peptidyl-prolyl cis-trans isomerase [Microbacterium festucae]MCT9820174.1 FKBP-type peptidyl-prolyl cis-trans isomerase [Microbacterium festucae]
MRRIPAVVAVIGLSALALVGCSSASSTGAAADCERGDHGSSALGLITATGEVGTPGITLTDPVYVDSTSFTDETVGDGPTITTGAQDVVFSVAVANGATGTDVLQSGTPVRAVDFWKADYAGFADMLMCAREGSRIIGAVPFDALSEQAAQNWGVQEGQSIAVVMDVQKVYKPAADGAPQYNDRRGMPTVVLAPDGRPGIIVPDGAAPDDLAVEVLKKGDGPTVGAGDAIRVHYTGVNWADKKVFDSTWEKGASTALSLDAVVPGFAQALDGQTVGSQILVVIPPELGYGDQASAAVPANSTLVFVIDILGVDDPATASSSQ